MKALGGGVGAGTSYLVGENGPEIFTPSQSGRISPNPISGNISPVINFTYAPMISTASKSEAEWVIKPILQKLLKEM